MSDISQDRTLPHNIEAEQAVLGAIFLVPDMIVTATEILEPEDFYRVSHQRIFSMMIRLTDKGEPIDLVTITTELDDLKMLDEVGGVSYLTDIANSVPTAANIEYYARIVEEKSTLRKIIHAATDIVTKTYDEGDEVTDLLDHAEKTILDISQNKSSGRFQNIQDVLVGVYDNIEQLHNMDEEVTGIATGFRDLDYITSGFQKNDLIIVAARPSVGKTAFALNIAQNVAVNSDENVAIFSLEMGADQLVMRMLCAEGNIDAQRLRTGKLQEED